MSEIDIDAAKAAFAQVHGTVNQLGAEYKNVKKRIKEVVDTIAQTRGRFLPLADVKAVVLEFVDVAGNAYKEEVLVPAIKRFVEGSSNHGQSDYQSRPITFTDIGPLLNGVRGTGLGSNLVSNNIDKIPHAAFYFYFGEQIKGKLAEVMNEMLPHEFGYDSISPEAIGTDRADRIQELTQMNQVLSNLNQRKDDLAGMLRSLGIIDFDDDPSAGFAKVKKV